MTRLSTFESAVLPHLDAAYNLARWITRNDHDAEDVVQEAYLRAFRYFDSLKGAEGRSWLLAIVRNTSYSWLEKNRPADLAVLDDADAVIDAMPSPTPSPEVIVLQSANRKLVNQALEDLPVAFREVIVLREIEDMSYKEVAVVAGIPIGTVMSRLARGREMLKRAIDARNRKVS